MSSFGVSGDIQISDDGRELLLVTQEDAIVQSLINGAQVFKGSWRYDLSKGIPYFNDVLVLGPEEAVIREVFRKYVQETPGIDSVIFVKLRFEKFTGLLFVDFRARAESGQEISSTFEYALVS